MTKTFRYSEQNLETVRVFFERAGLAHNHDTKADIEFRDSSWWEAIDRIGEMGIVFCSDDAPGLPRAITTTGRSIYLRIHGYKEWYRYIYSKTELDDLNSVMNLNAKKKAIYLNNDRGCYKMAFTF